MKIYIKSFQILMLTFLVTSVFAHIGPQTPKKGNAGNENTKTNFREDCQPGIAEIDQSINNVRARLSTGGDVWWNRQEGLYIVPKPGEGQDPVSSIFAGGVWVGGTTRSQNLKLAGVTYRSLTNNYDWYPGPLDEMGVTDEPICNAWDQFFHVLAVDIAKHNDAWENQRENYDCDSIPDAVKYWPGKGNPFWREKYDFDLPDQPLGAFYDTGPNDVPDGVYNPCDGDFPTIEIEKCIFGDRNKSKELIPDEMYFWIYNDNGGPHLLTGGEAIQMEVQVQAFAYATNDEVNDMTFQRYRLLNKANEDLIDCYFAMWVDPDLGCAFDDYSGTDNTLDALGKPRSLAYTYNEDAVDGDNGPNCSSGSNTYEFEVPIIGTDYFRGPLGPKVFLRDDDGELILDSLGNKILLNPIPGTGVSDTSVELGMTSCIFTFNCGSNPPNQTTCDPENEDIQFYNNLRGLWRFGEPITFGGTGFDPSSQDTVKFMFSDEPNDPTGWSMCNVGLSNVDTRTLQATGPLLLQPGATNELIIGVVWVPDLEYPCPDIARLQSADDIAQALFDNCFDITDGPDAPDMCGIELDKEIILTLTNSSGSNNFEELYEEVDLNYTGPEDGDNTYNFEGYKVYQLRDGGVSAQELDNIEKARLIYQVDVTNEIGEIFNWTSDSNPLQPGERIWSFTREVAGDDVGIDRTFQFVEDQFALGNDRSLINHKSYHFMVLAYAHNNWENFDIDTEIGQRRAYLEGRRNVKVNTFVPRPIVYQNLNAEYGDGAIITRIEGQGNNGIFLDLADGEAQSFVDGTFDGRITYKEGAGPFEVKVFNPLEVQNGNYRLEFVGEFNDASSVCALLPGARWVLTDLDSGEEIASEKSIDEINEQIIVKKGFSITLAQAEEPGLTDDKDNGAIGVQFEYTDPNADPWYIPVTSAGTSELVESFVDVFTNLPPGVAQYNPNSVLTNFDADLPRDPNNVYANFGGGAFMPLYTTRVQTTDANQQAVPPYLSAAGPRTLQSLARNQKNLAPEFLNNVDIVFTDNKDLWSRCIVVETASSFHYDNLGLDTELGTERFEVIEKPSLDRNGNPDNSGTEGFSWFPGYAVDVETGQRLNIFFGENTIYHGDRAELLNDPSEGADLIWNPTSQLISEVGQMSDFANLVMGGQHYIYVTRQIYDGCEQLGKEFSKNVIPFSSLGAITWTGFPIVSASNPLKSMEDGLIPAELTVKLRVNNKFRNETRIEELNRLTRCDEVESLPLYEFSLSGKELDELEETEYEGALANVNVVPNPYYAYSSYETSALVNTIKITNLPDRASVTIYSIDGKYIRQYDRDESTRIKSDPSVAIGFSQTSSNLEWDLKNHKGIPIASGVYLIHVIAPELNEERVIKWFGVNRKFDPTGL